MIKSVTSPIKKLHSHGKTGSSEFSVIFGLQLGILLIGTLYIRSKFGQDDPVVTYYQLLFLLWPFVFFRNIGKSFSAFFHNKLISRSILLFAISCVLSSVYSPHPMQSVVMGLLVVVSFTMFFVFSLNMGGDESVAYVIYSFFGVCFCSFFLLSGDTVGGGRLGGILNPNSIGMICVSLIFSSFFIKKIYLRHTAIVIFFITLIKTGSRSSLLGVIVGLAVYYVLKKNKKKNYLAVSLSIFFCMFLIAGIFLYYDSFVGTIEQLFYLTDKYRGIGTGGTGRFNAWVEAWGVFWEHPWIGVGYRSHESFMTTHSSAHNGYLATLAELGVVGFSSAMLVVFVGVRGLLKQVSLKENLVKLSLVSSYLVVCVFERYLFNVGNPSSLLFMYGVISGTVVKKAPLKSQQSEYIGNKATGVQSCCTRRNCMSSEE